MHDILRVQPLIRNTVGTVSLIVLPGVGSYSRTVSVYEYALVPPSLRSVLSRRICETDRLDRRHYRVHGVLPVMRQCACVVDCNHTPH